MLLLVKSSLLLACLAVALTGCAGKSSFLPETRTTNIHAPHRTKDAAPLATVQAASRLLDQATFGPTLTDIQHVQQIGLAPYVARQIATAPTYLADIMVTDKVAGQRHEIESNFYFNALSAPDQLRQRVAFALSEIFVVSDAAAVPYEITPFHNLLLADSFGNFRTLLHDVSTSTAMGDYLNMLNSAAPIPGQIANENYARELMQLFTIGPNQLNPDGTLVLDANGNPIPTYTADQVQAFARAYTGWTYANADRSPPTVFPNPDPGLEAVYDVPMVPVASAHDTGQKILLDGTVLPPGQSASQDLEAALDNIFAQPNVGPFVCRQLIQHLVMGNPSPAYVARIAAVFNDDGTGTRGNLAAVITAILLDHKARAGDVPTLADTPIDGHLREPLLYVANLLRGLSFTYSTYVDFTGAMYLYAEQTFQPPYGSPSVFNFFPPDYTIPGTTTNAPEFALENTASSMLRITIADEIIHNANYGITVDLSATSPLGTIAASSTADLIDTLGLMFMHGQMPANMRQALINHVSTLSDPAQAARVATFLVVTSPQYKDLH